MKSTIKLTDIKNLDLGTKIACLEVTIENKALGFKSIFSLESTGMSLRVVSPMLISDMRNLTKWLDSASSNDDNLRSNDGELRILAKNFIKLQKELDREVTL
tara:strand:- start:225 stop:530 length:306 start_codon:yes stop_codon:yes gene_type:complete